MSDAGMVVVAVLVGIFVGWGAAHGTVADECKKLGGFYVAKTVFECKVKEGTKP